MLALTKLDGEAVEDQSLLSGISRKSSTNSRRNRACSCVNFRKLVTRSPFQKIHNPPHLLLQKGHLFLPAICAGHALSPFDPHVLVYLVQRNNCCGGAPDPGRDILAVGSANLFSLGTRAQILTGHMVKTLRSQSTFDSNMPSDQILSTF